MNAGPGATVVLEVTALDPEGDGLATLADGRRVRVPLALPGERVEARLAPPPPALRRRGRRIAARPAGGGPPAATVARWLVRSERRAAPRCPHFGDCGGCTAQHLADDDYRAWTLGLVRGALAQHRLDPDVVAAPIFTAPAGRRRVRLAARRIAAGVVLGFNARGSHRIVDLVHCAVTVPALVGVVAPLRDALAALWPPGTTGDLSLTLTQSGIDLLMVTAWSPDAAGRLALARLADTLDLARLSLAPDDAAEPEPLALRRAPVVAPGGVPVQPPPGAFLQASAEAEAILVALVREAAAGAARVADLHAGLGTFALPLAADGARVLAVDRDAAALAALAAAARAAGLDRITIERRDLDRRPLAGAELSGLDAVVLDPPRAGAQAAARALAADGPGRIVYVACRPGTFARDARLLVDGGYRLVRVRPVDQFVWSGHVELVAEFEREP